jgi:hypothetical protein
MNISDEVIDSSPQECVGERETPAGLMTSTAELTPSCHVMEGKTSIGSRNGDKGVRPVTGQVLIPSRHVMEAKASIASRNGDKTSIASRNGDKTSIASRNGDKTSIASRNGDKTSIASRNGDKSIHHVTEWKRFKDGHVNPISMEKFCGQDEKMTKSRISCADVMQREKVAEATFSRKLKL